MPPVERTGANLRVGIFVLVALGLFVIGLVVLGAGWLFRTAISFETYMTESVQGLEIGSPVRQFGVQVGTVSSIGFVASTYEIDTSTTEGLRLGRLVRVQFNLYPEAFSGYGEGDVAQLTRRLVENGLRARVASQGLTGAAYLELSFLNPDNYPSMAIRWQPRDPYIPSAPSTITQFTTAAERVLRNLQDVDLQKLGVEATQTISDVRDVVGGLKLLLAGPSGEKMRSDVLATTANVRQISEDTKTQLAGILRTTEQTSQQIAELSTHLNEALTRERLDRTAANTDRLIANLTTVSQALPEVIADLRRTLERADGLLTDSRGDIQRTLDNLSTASDNIRELTDSARQFPGQLLLGTPPPDQSRR